MRLLVSIKPWCVLFILFVSKTDQKSKICLFGQIARKIYFFTILVCKNIKLLRNSAAKLQIKTCTTKIFGKKTTQNCCTTYFWTILTQKSRTICGCAAFFRVCESISDGRRISTKVDFCVSFCQFRHILRCRNYCRRVSAILRGAAMNFRLVS